MKKVQLFICLALVTVASSDTGYRLPTIYSPSLYKLDLEVPSEVFTTDNATNYTGKVSITLSTSENVSQIFLHASADYINITSINLMDNETTTQISNFNVNSTTDIVTIDLGSFVLITGQEYILTINFDGKLSTTDLYGFYKSSYTDGNNVTSYLANTQMEATYARRAFPCFDEPQYKAKFNVILTYPLGLSALGNMAENVTTTNSTKGTKTTLFNTTPTMSTYLVAFIISNFTCTSNMDLEGNLLNKICSRKETESSRKLALEVTPLAVEQLNSYLNINYSVNMNKLEQVAVPLFPIGAMENWGLIIYKDESLLYDENETTNEYQQYTVSTIPHELSHQWFGNLVTLKWWSEVFLNEGFATFFESYITHAIYPQLEMDKQFVIKTLHNSFERDTSSTEALHEDAETENEISSRFSDISYDKGASILRMVEHILGTEDWKAKLTIYLNTYAHSSAVSENLWEILGTNLTNLPADNLSVVMENWIYYPGFPVVNVSLKGSELTFTQERFVFGNSTNKTNTWYVPLTYTTSENTLNFENTAPTAWLCPNSSLTVNVSCDISWIVVNNLQTGYYRVNYDSSLWSKLAVALQQTNFSCIPVINRAQIVNDAFNLARIGYITYTQLFNTIDFLSKETSYIVWYPAFRGLNYLIGRIGQNSTLGAAISSHILNLTIPLIDSVPITVRNSSNNIYTLNQVQAQTWACRLGNSNCTTEAVRLFQSFKNTSIRPDKNLRYVVYCYGLKYSSDISSDWDYLWNALFSTNLLAEKVIILDALGCSENETILNSYLSKTLSDDSGIQDYTSVFSAVYRGSSTGLRVAFDFFYNFYDDIITRFASWQVESIVLGLGLSEQITTTEQIAKLQTLINSGKLNGTVLESANVALASAQKNEEWVNTYKSNLEDYFGISND